MRIITTTCSNCGTIVSGTLLEAERLLKCPGYQCHEIRRFDELSEIDRAYLIERATRIDD